MNYEQKYKEAFERAKKEWSSNLDGAYKNYRERLETIFPELTESNDEKIRKALIDFFSISAYNGEQTNGVSDKDIIAWIEKQGEHKPIINVPSREIILSIWDLGNEWKELTGGCISAEYGTQLDYIQKHWNESEYYLKETQGEYEKKSTDKVKPKFHEGDWAVSNLDKNVRQISEVHFDEYNSYYVVNGKFVNLEEYDRLHHLWTIEDAKPGDVLYYKSDNNIEYIVMNKGINMHGNIDSYFRYNSLDGFALNVPAVLSAENDNITLATKEQRDTLEMAITNAGYRWDKEKLKLEKI